AYLLETVDHAALEAELADAARELARRGLRVVHWQRRKRRIPRRVLRDGFGHAVVGLACDGQRLVPVEDALHTRRVQRQDRKLYTRVVHVAEALGAQIEQLPREVVPLARVAGEAARFLERLLDGEVLLERDLSLHCDLPLSRHRRIKA